MNKSWLSLNIYSDSDKHEIISSYFDSFSLGNQFMKDHFIVYLPLDYKNIAGKVLDNIHDQYDIKFNWKEIEHENWMSNWKKNFTPVNIKDTVLIVPDSDNSKNDFLYTIKINPAMAFGTGHHASTQLMIENMLEYNIKKYSKVLDLGCGSGILSILAKKMGVQNILALDNDPVCEDNFVENCNLNKVDGIKLVIDDVHKFADYNYDVILANINKNNVIKIIEKFEMLNSKAILIVSGLLDSDLAEIENKLKQSCIEKIKQQEEWISLVIKNK